MNRETPSLKLYSGSIPMNHSIPKSWQNKMHRLVWRATHTQSLHYRAEGVLTSKLNDPALTEAQNSSKLPVMMISCSW